MLQSIFQKAVLIADFLKEQGVGGSARGRAGPRVIKQQLQGLDNLTKMRVVFSKTGAAQCR